MVDNIEDGGQAFPTIHGYVDRFGSVKQSNGLSLRDYFAAQALMVVGAYSCQFMPEHAAQEAFKIADAMIKARKGGARC